MQIFAALKPEVVLVERLLVVYNVIMVVLNLLGLYYGKPFEFDYHTPTFQFVNCTPQLTN